MNCERIFGYDLKEIAQKYNAGFRPLSFEHIITMIVIAILGILIIAIMKRDKNEMHRAIVRYVLAFIMIFEYAFFICWRFVGGKLTLANGFPFHLCDIIIILTIIMLITRSKKLFDFVYILGIGGALQALFTPDTPLTFPHIRFVQSFAHHGGIIIGAFYMTLVEGYRPYIKSLPRVFIIANIYMVVVYVLNLIIGHGANYMFLVTYEAETIIETLYYKLGHPGYILGLELIGGITIAILYLPWAIIDLVKAETSEDKKKYTKYLIITLGLFAISVLAFVSILFLVPNNFPPLH